MRLSPEQQEALVRIVRKHLNQKSDVYLFGSRLDDTAKGGDVDILVEVERPVLKIAHVRLMLDLIVIVYEKYSITKRRLDPMPLLEKALGDRKIDLITALPGDDRAIVGIAMATGVEL